MVIAVGSLPIAGPRCGIELGADPASIDDGAPRTAISEMVRKEALALLRQQLDRYRTRSHRELQSSVTEPEVVEVVGPSGTRFCIEVLAVWNNKVGGDIRVVGAIDMVAAGVRPLQRRLHHAPRWHARVARDDAPPTELVRHNDRRG